MSCTQRTLGQLVEQACVWEVQARKAGNVGPGWEYADLRVEDFLASAAAIAPILEQAPLRPLGDTILAAIEATRRVAATNTNLGMVLLLAPLASVPLDQPLLPTLPAQLRRLTVEDARQVYRAIRRAQPSGLGQAAQQDVGAEPTLPLREVMGLARARDRIAEQYVTDFQGVLNEAAPLLIHEVQQGPSLERAIIQTQLILLARHPDSHIARKRGNEEARQVQERARQLWQRGDLDTPAGRQAYRDFDAHLRADNHARNPGTTADLLAAGLFVALRQDAIPRAMPFVWEDHPLGPEPGL